MRFCVLLHVSMSASPMGTLLNSMKISVLQWVASVLVTALAAAFAGGKADAITHAGQAQGELACSYSMANGGSPSSTYGPSANGHLPDLDQDLPVDSLHILPNGVMDNGSPDDHEPSPHRVSLSVTGHAAWLEAVEWLRRELQHAVEDLGRNVLPLSLTCCHW